MISLLSIGESQTEVDRGQGWFELYGFTIGSNGGIGLFAAQERMAELIPGFGILWFELDSCQFLAQNTHPYTSPEKGRKALLERLCQRM